MGKSFKHQAYLDKYKKCPKDDCKEKDLTAFRWAHNPPTPEDFCPVLLNNPLRAFDDNDKDCTGYALSLFKDAKHSIARYCEIYGNMDKPKRRESFKERNGTVSVKINITKNDGVSDMPNADGHFNFFEYQGCNLFMTISEILDNFTKDGKS